MITPARDKLRRFVRSFFRPVERLRPSELCEKYLKLPPGHGETKGGLPVSFAERPYLREPIDVFAEPGVTDVVVCGPTRIGKTFIFRMLFAWSIAFDPAPAMWVDTTVDTARRVSKKELQPLVEYNAILRSRKPENRHNYADLTMLFPGAAFGMVGANSDSQVAGDTVQRVFGNEVGKWRGATEKDANIQEQVRHRTESYEQERRHGWSCTPDLEEGLTWQLVQRGDCRKWFVPCPRCGTLQELAWGAVDSPGGVWWDPEAKGADGKWDLARVKRSARYRCENVACLAHSGPAGWTDAERLAAVQDPRAHYRPTKFADVTPGWRSYILNGLYGPLEANNVGELAVDFLAARSSGFFTNRQDFWNSRMGLPWTDSPSMLDAGKFAKRELVPIGKDPATGREICVTYLRGEVPDGFVPDLFIVGFDVQANRLEYVVRAFDWAGRSFTVDHGQVSHWRDLEQVQTDYAQKFKCTSFVIGDVNYEERRAEALEQIYFREKRGWFAAEAFEVAAERVRIEFANVYAGGKLGGQKDAQGRPKYAVKKLVISAYEFKVELEKRFNGEIGNWFTYSLPLAASDDDVEERAEYFAQLLDERRVPRKKRRAGKPPFEFKSRAGNNHAFDCEVYILALFWTLQKSRTAAAKKQSAGREVRSLQR
jgi:phage terminase large subunit GpA-like protein